MTPSGAAAAAIKKALAQGAITRPDFCEACGNFGPQAADGRATIQAFHHKGYDNLLDVRWLCLRCRTEGRCASRCAAWRAAKEAGLKTYLPESACANGHMTERRVSNFQCIACYNEWRNKNSERVSAANKKWCEDNKERVRQNKRVYKAANRERINKINKESAARCRVAYNERCRVRYHENRDAQRARSKEKRIRRAEVDREYRRTHKVEKSLSRKRRRHLELITSAGPIKASDVRALFEAQRRKCGYCRQKITLAAAHLDHIVPLAKGGPHTISNLQWLCAPCNLSKNSRHPIDFARERGLLI